MDRMLYWAVQSQGKWRSISTALFPDRHRGRPPHPSKRRGDCSTIIEEREVGWSRRHPSRTGPSRGEDVITALTTICNKIWQTGEWPTPWTQSLVITLPRKGNLRECQNYRTISLISHPLWMSGLKATINRQNCKQTSSSEDLTEIVIFWLYKPLLWPWHWT